MPLIKLNAHLRNITKIKEVSIQGDTLSEVITHLIEVFPDLKDVILNENQIRNQIIITINGRHSSDLAQTVNVDDVIAIFPPIAGG